VTASLVAGASAAAGLKLPARMAATLTAFGGGILLAAVAVELVPEADEQAGRWVTAAGLLAGRPGRGGPARRVLIGNVVEAYGAAQPIIAAGRPRGFAVALLAAIGLALAGATVLGGTVLADASPTLIGGAEALASGAVLAVVSVPIIPYAFSEVSRMVAAAAVVGFVGGYLLS
jgi:ZIP family zinc transporter